MSTGARMDPAGAVFTHAAQPRSRAASTLATDARMSVRAGHPFAAPTKAGGRPPRSLSGCSDSGNVSVPYL